MTLRSRALVNGAHLDSPGPVEADRKGVQSIEVGGELLRVLSRHAEPLPLKDVAAEAGMTPAKAHPYLVGYCKIKLAEQDAKSGHYRLGALALRLGLAALVQSATVQQAIAMVEVLKERTRHTTVLALWSPQGPTIVHMAEVDFPLETNLRIGSTMSVLTTATGRVFSAFLPESTTRRLVDAELARVSKSKSELAHLEATFRHEVDVTRARRMARSLGQPLPGINALSAPVFQADGSLSLAVTVYGPQGRFDANWSGPTAKELKRCCASVPLHPRPQRAG
jgi:DNA-binding IclR family transcriptional regulator